MGAVHFLIERKTLTAPPANRIDTIIKALNPKSLLQDAATLDRKLIDDGVKAFVVRGSHFG